jgi:hypothetical protein
MCRDDKRSWLRLAQGTERINEWRGSGLVSDKGPPVGASGLPLLLEPAIPPLLRRLDSLSPLRAQQAGFGDADLVKHDGVEPKYDLLKGKCEADKTRRSTLVLFIPGEARRSAMPGR